VIIPILGVTATIEVGQKTKKKTVGTTRNVGLINSCVDFIGIVDMYALGTLGTPSPEGIML